MKNNFHYLRLFFSLKNYLSRQILIQNLPKTNRLLIIKIIVKCLCLTNCLNLCLHIINDTYTNLIK